MAEIKILKKSAVEKFEDDFSSYRKDQDKLQRLMDQQSVGTGIYFEKKKLDPNDDFISSKLVYQSLKNINTVMASDERLWIYLFHTEYNEYRKERISIQYHGKEPDDKKLMSNTLFTGNNNDKIRAKFLNYLSRLWWAGYFTDGVDEYLHLLTDIDFSGIMTSYFASTLTSVKEIRMGTFDAIIDFQKLLDFDNDIIKKVVKEVDGKYAGHGVRNLLVESNRYLNIVSSGVVLDLYSEKEIEDMVLNHLKEKYL